MFFANRYLLRSSWFHPIILFQTKYETHQVPTIAGYAIILFPLITACPDLAPRRGAAAVERSTAAAMVVKVALKRDLAW
jgi:hypothetical protein